MHPLMHPIITETRAPNQRDPAQMAAVRVTAALFTF